jgi:hypothetical protein
LRLVIAGSVGAGLATMSLRHSLRGLIAVSSTLTTGLQGKPKHYHYACIAGYQIRAKPKRMQKYKNDRRQTIVAVQPARRLVHH